MKIHEYQAKALISEYGIPVPRGEIARSPEQAAKITESLGNNVVIKAKIYYGGRGKRGGIQTATSAAQAERVAASMLGSRLKTGQTREQGFPVNAVLVEESVSSIQELY